MITSLEAAVSISILRQPLFSFWGRSTLGFGNQKVVTIGKLYCGGFQGAGQLKRQAVLFEAVSALGVKKFYYMNRDFQTGKVLIALVPIINDSDKLIKAARETPLLENSRKAKRTMNTNFGGANV